MKQNRFENESVKMVHLVNILLAAHCILFTVTAVRVTKPEDEDKLIDDPDLEQPVEAALWQQTPNDQLPTLINNLQKGLIKYFKQNYISVDAVVVAKVIDSFQREHTDCVLYEIRAMVKMNGGIVLLHVDARVNSPGEFDITDVEFPFCNPLDPRWSFTPFS